jgi:hypothetical protein
VSGISSPKEGGAIVGSSGKDCSFSILSVGSGIEVAGGKSEDGGACGTVTSAISSPIDGGAIGGNKEVELSCSVSTTASGGDTGSGIKGDVGRSKEGAGGGARRVG